MTSEKINAEFKSAVLMASQSKPIPTQARGINQKSGMRNKVLRVFGVMPMGNHITRTALGDLIGKPMPMGNCRGSKGSTNCTTFNHIKCGLKKAGLIEETYTVNKDGDREYYYTLIRQVVKEDYKE